MEKREIDEKSRLLDVIIMHLNEIPFPNIVSTVSFNGLSQKVITSYEQCSRLLEVLNKCEAEIALIRK